LGKKKKKEGKGGKDRYPEKGRKAVLSAPVQLGEGKKGKRKKKQGETGAGVSVFHPFNPQKEKQEKKRKNGLSFLVKGGGDAKKDVPRVFHQKGKRAFHWRGARGKMVLEKELPILEKKKCRDILWEEKERPGGKEKPALPLMLEGGERKKKKDT